MKRIHYYLLPLIFCACDSYLDIVPDNIATIDYAFRDRAGAESFLATCYYYMPNIGSPPGDPGLMGGDDTWSLVDVWSNAKTGDYNCYNIKINQNTNSPYANFWEGANGGRDMYQAIRDCNIFLENIDKVGPDLSEEDKLRWIAEVKFLKAYYHYYLWRAYGPIPLVRQNMTVDAGIDEVRVYRDKFDDCVDYSVQLINEAVPDLPLVLFDISTELRRITQPIALAMKAEMLVTAASPLFNNNQRLSGLTDNRNVKLFESELSEKDKWERARTACKNAIDTIELARASGQIYELYDFSKSVFYPNYSTVSDTSKLVMTLRSVLTDKWNSEIIWGTALGENYTKCTMAQFDAGHANAAFTEPVIAPTMRMVELFYSNRGVPINEDKYYDYDNRFKTEATPEDLRYYIKTDYITAKINMYREPRFYANLGFDGGYWLGNGKKMDFDGLPAAETAWVTQMLKGKPSGNFIGLRYSITGYAVKKGSHIETTVTTGTSSSLNLASGTFPIIRLADLYLLYAEALNECLEAPNAEVYDYVNRIRTRAGLEGVVESWAAYTDPPDSDKPLYKSSMRDIIRQERMIELAFEGKRFWDVRRWLLAETELNKPIRAWNIMGEVPEDYYNVITLHQLSFSEKEYLWPIRQGELLKNTNLLQNPGW
ncbi:MAG: RagB/SusD family nutrient uptake outer membrane protein [Bacteroidales bacterium]|jgi:hypothetical protein|nr:RagB/SusD family nutrient uptake outer membrane protein [Bacteroidales bacterium]